MKYLHTLFILFCLLVSSCNQEKYDITFSSLLDEMIDYEEAARYPVISFSCRQESSYDRRSVHPDSVGWFANNDGFGIIRVDTLNGRKENVLFDQEFEKENNIYGIAMAKLNEQMLYDPKEYIENSLEFIRNHDVSVKVFHPGYLDQYIPTHSSFTLIRAMECDFLCSSWLKDWLKEYQIELTDFRKVKNA